MDCLEGLKMLDDNSIDMTVTSPPYDDLRKYKGYVFDFENIAKEIFRVTRSGGVVVWIVGDSTINDSESGTSFKQALFLKDCGFKLHDTMIYEKDGSAFPAKRTSKRYSQIFEYMFVFCKGKIRSDITLLCDKPNKWAGHTNWGNKTQYDKDGNLKQTSSKPVPDFSLRNNIWKYSTGFNDKTSHPAVFPEKLAEDHILSWSNEGDLVLDPFMGSGTTAKMALLNKRNYIGFEDSKEYCNIAMKRLGKYDSVDMLSSEKFG